MTVAGRLPPPAVHHGVPAFGGIADPDLVSPIAQCRVYSMALVRTDRILDACLYHRRISPPSARHRPLS